jgi:hypothetical protein
MDCVSAGLAYWGIQPPGMAGTSTSRDYARLLFEFSNEGVLNALRTYTIVRRDRDVLLIPPNSGNLLEWRLIYSIAPKAAALDAIARVRSGALLPRD